MFKEEYLHNATDLTLGLVWVPGPQYKHSCLKFLLILNHLVKTLFELKWQPPSSSLTFLKEHFFGRVFESRKFKSKNQGASSEIREAYYNCHHDHWSLPIKMGERVTSRPSGSLGGRGLLFTGHVAPKAVEARPLPYLSELLLGGSWANSIPPRAKAGVTRSKRGRPGLCRRHKPGCIVTTSDCLWSPGPGCGHRTR